MVERADIVMVLAGVLGAGVCVGAAMGGPLVPPGGPIVSTGKTLTEVEPRIAINATNTPGDSVSVFRIAQPGSYYLTANVAGAASRNGIRIAASNVTIDLNGFVVQGVALALRGIATEGVIDNITIRNGTVTGWPQAGIDLQAGGAGSDCLIENIIAASNGAAGIQTNTNAVVRNCVAQNNATAGIVARDFAVVSGCTARSNLRGFDAGKGVTFSDCVSVGNSLGYTYDSGATFLNCSARDNELDGFRIFQVSATSHSSTFTNCVAVANGNNGFNVDDNTTIANCSSGLNAGHGFVLGDGGQISGSTAWRNGLSGVRLGSNNLAKGNTCTGNGTSDVNGAGISAAGSRNRIEANVCAQNGRGVSVEGTQNLIVRNACSGNTVHWVFSAGNSYGPLVVASTNGAALSTSGASPGTIGSSDPNANIAH